MEPLTLLLALLSIAQAVVGPLAAGHALLNKREPSVAMAWIAVCLAFPVAGPLIYFFFGINRVRTRARKLLSPGAAAPDVSDKPPSPCPTDGAPSCSELVRSADAITGRTLYQGNRLEPLHDGETAYPRMLQAIEEARERLFLSTYIFKSDRIGQRFVHALSQAHRRGVDVRVLVDGVGEWYTFPHVSRLLRRAGVRHARFLAPHLLPPEIYINLRNHRKLLVADGHIGFTGGMNISDHHLTSTGAGRRPVQDLHFRVTGPVVADLEQVFLEDWAFATGDENPVPEAALEHHGPAACRAIVDGPNEDLDRLLMIMVAAISAARQSVWIMTPYFLPPRPLTTALQAAALRGVTVNILLPRRSNLPYVDWASRHMLWELLHWGVKVWYQPAPFNHSKLLVIDDHYSHLGSANLDPRSLRLNFELTLEAHDREFAEQMVAHCRKIQAVSEPAVADELHQRSLPVRARDALFWLLSPYL
ncbi:cardiolipin synthase [Alkalispirillum mobile]|uniref:Cardiolipin synthase n=1 Tax=Alkalispirillum mobile TaxID=85925 RepID=A0A498C8M3_9GAMM|nr:cardiolipin synthase [Alkalispirillum mobile]RLK51449.1 cardiolipin synthase [Alkalispirillum mobile]